MIELEPEIQAELDWVLSQIEDVRGYHEPHYLTTEDVVRAHFYIANRFYLEGEGLGGLGPRSIGLLQSAVSRQSVSFGGRQKWSHHFDVCATLFFGLIKNHPFHDANKRTAFLSALFFLRRCGWCPSVSEKEFEDFTVEIADDQLQKYARYRELEKAGEGDSEVRFISWYLRKHTRRIDRHSYDVTFRQLQKILNRYGFALSNPHGNHIDIMQVKAPNGLLRLFGRKEDEVRLGQIGFPRWTAQVGKAALKTVRDVTKLNHENGVDSASFFQGLDPMESLITTYYVPLMRLAQR